MKVQPTADDGDAKTSTATIVAVATTTFATNTANVAPGRIQTPATNRAPQQQIRLHDGRSSWRTPRRHVHHAKQREAENDVQRDRHHGNAERRAVSSREAGGRRHFHETEPEQSHRRPAATTTPSSTSNAVIAPWKNTCCHQRQRQDVDAAARNPEQRHVRTPQSMVRSNAAISPRELSATGSATTPLRSSPRRCRPAVPSGSE